MRFRQLIIATWSLLTSPFFVKAPRRGHHTPDHTQSIDHRALDNILTSAQHLDGTIDYHAIDIHAINAYINQLSAANPDHLSDDNERLAFWINLYNALVIQQVIIHHYPDSVQSVDGFFTTPCVTIAGESLSLDGIEHGKVRRFADPRIHAALVCGAQGCPIVTTYTPDTLNDSLNNALQTFLADPTRGIAYDPATDTVTITPILRWFAGDFAGPLAYVSIKQLTPIILPYLSDAGQRAWHAGRIHVRTYDWRLNQSDAVE
jgi:hypothetical protein